VHEFAKRLDSELPFYYYTSSRNRFYEGKCLILTPKEIRVAELSTFLNMNYLDLTVEIFFLCINLLQSEPHFIMHQFTYHHHQVQLIN